MLKNLGRRGLAGLTIGVVILGSTLGYVQGKAVPWGLCGAILVLAILALAWPQRRVVDDSV